MCSNQNLKNNKRKHKFSNKTMASTKATVRRINAPSFVAATGQRIGNKNILKRRNTRFKIKTILPKQKQMEVKKNGQVVCKMIVKRVAHYFSGNR